jgi:hypothetical protein
MTDAPRPDAEAMDVDEDPDSTQIEPAQVDDFGIEIDFEELDEELRTELVEILENVSRLLHKSFALQLTPHRRRTPTPAFNNKLWMRSEKPSPN